MPLKSCLSVPIPDTSIPSWLFGSPTAPLSQTPLIMDADNAETRWLSLDTYRSIAQRFAAGLRSAGLQTGDRVLLVSGNSLAFYAIYMGTIMAGGVFSGASENMTATRIRYQASDLDAKFILSSPRALELCLEAVSESSIKVHVADPESLFGNAPVETQQAHQKYHSWSELLGDKSQSQSFDWSKFCSDPAQLSAINYTSGSTGDAKGVMTTHRNQIANSVQWISMQQQDPEEAIKAKSISWIGWLPMIHVFGQTQFLLTGPKRGIRNYLMQSFDLEKFLSNLEKFRATEIFGVPQIVIAMANSPLAKSTDLSSVQSIYIGGSPLKRPICERLEKLVGNPDVVVKQAWGMTEMTCIPLCWHPQEKLPSVSVGELMPNCEGKIMSLDAASELGANQRGEMWIRAPTVTQGYWKKPEKTASAFMSDGWLRTGDLAYYDEQGHWFVIDRLRELITTSDGHHFVPSELESIILDVPGIIDAGVVSVDRGEAGTKLEPRAFIVLDPAAGVTPGSVQQALETRLEAGLRISGGIFAIAEIPKLQGSKVDRVKLRTIDVRSLVGV